MMTLHAQTITRLAPAKINLALHVTGQRSDGYHLLDMLVVFADFGDIIHLTSADEDHFHITGPYAASIPNNADNLIIQARDRIRLLQPELCHPVSIVLEKNLPIAAGIGGGSSDAAAALIGLEQLWKLTLSADRLSAISLALGADVPICLHGQRLGSPILARGIGEHIFPVDTMPALPLVLINDGTRIATPEVFRRLDKRNNLPLPAIVTLPDIAAVCAYLGQTRNDLLDPACELAPALRLRLNCLRQAGAYFAQMSGSGATCFGIFDSVPEADKAARFIASKHPDWFVRSTMTKPSGQF